MLTKLKSTTLLIFFIFTIHSTSFCQSSNDCLPVSLLTEMVGKTFDVFMPAINKKNLITKNVVDLPAGGKIYEFVPSDYSDSYRIVITTNEKDESIRVKLTSVYHDCWKSFVAVAKGDPQTYVNIMSEDKAAQRLGVYDISKVYRVAGTSRTTDGKTEISLNVTKIKK